MTPQRLRTKLRKIREHGEEMAEEGGELNLVPYLDIVTNVIMFMLATTTFAAALGDINISTPGYARDTALAEEPPPDKPKNELNLTVNVGATGFTILTSGTKLFQGFSFDPSGSLKNDGTALPTIPKKGAEYDYDFLARKMQEIKNVPDAKDETKVIVNADPAIPYEIVVNTMDACRNNGPKLLFPDVLLSAGVN
jgi:biopolymer transport protein TolR